MSETEPPVYNLRPAEGVPQPIVVSIPHTGTYVPPDIAVNFASDGIRALPMTDWHLHHLYDFLPALGITTLYANYSRLVVDLNRPPDAKPLYPGRYETGLVASETFQGEIIYRDAPDSAEVERRRLRYHAPYHERLASLLDEYKVQFGQVVLLDAHSVASAANQLHGPLSDDIYLGNRDGHSSPPWLIERMSGAFAEAGLRVVQNSPYKGGYITAHYGGIEGVDALQIEMVQRLYMDEDDPAVAVGMPQFIDLQRVLYGVISDLIGVVREHMVR